MMMGFLRTGRLLSSSHRGLQQLLVVVVALFVFFVAESSSSYALVVNAGVKKNRRGVAPAAFLAGRRQQPSTVTTTVLRAAEEEEVYYRNGKEAPEEASATTTTRNNGHHHVASSATAAAANGREKNANNNKNNDWGIPSSSTLQPLGPNHVTPVVPSRLPNGGRITLVGSGPGDPDLLTLSAYRLLTEDPTALVIADRLVSPEILSLIKAEVKTARKLPGCAELAQEEIYWWAYQGLQQGRHVIRLKIGDPFVFGRGGEEVLTFRRFGVEAAVVPGVSAAFSAPLLGNIPVTHRGVSNQVVMCTGYGREGSSPDLIRYHEEQTVVFLMAVGRLRELCARLQDLAGYPADTPVAIVEKAGCPDQRTVAGDMTTIADIAERHRIKPPSTIVVGKVVNVLLKKEQDTGDFVTGLIQNSTTAVAVA